MLLPVAAPSTKSSVVDQLQETNSPNFIKFLILFHFKSRRIGILMGRDMGNPSFWSSVPVYSFNPSTFRADLVYPPEPRVQHPRPSKSRGIPVQAPEPPVQHRKKPVEIPAKMSSTAPKVVQIPVHFVSAEPSGSASALKIQKVFRGFLARRSIKRILAIKRDVDEIERRISGTETLDLIRRNERERLRLNEMLMSLLFKLDSVRGIDSGVCVCRRAVIKKAIALQERIDAVVSAVDQSEIQILGEKDNGQDTEAVARTLGSTDSAAEHPIEFSNQIEEPAVVNFDHGPQEGAAGKDAGQGEVLEDRHVQDTEKPVVDHSERTDLGGDVEVNAEEENPAEYFDGICEVKESGVPSEMKGEDENCIHNEVHYTGIKVAADLGTRVKEEEQCAEKELMDQSVETSQTETLTEGGEVNNASLKCMEDVGEEEQVRTDDNKRNRELLERMMGDNEKMMKMMSQLCERNEMQTRMLNALTQKVEQLEKAFVCHRSRKKKGRHSA